MMENVATGSSSITAAMMIAAKATAAEWVGEEQTAAGATNTMDSQGTRLVHESARSEYRTCIQFDVKRCCGGLELGPYHWHPHEKHR